MIKLGILGANGKMGREVAHLAQSGFSDKAQLVAEVSENQPLHPLLQMDAVIDFSAPAGMLALAELAIAAPASQSLPAFIVGSTGWKIDERRRLEELSQRAPVLVSSNFSIGVLALTEVLRMAAPLLEKLGYTPVISEIHHKHKKDSPSGTALSLQRAISPAGPGNVQTHSIRAGEIIGDHEVTFYSTADHIKIGHFAQDRSIFARGALEAALWLAGRRSNNPSAGKLIGMDVFFKERIQ